MARKIAEAALAIALTATDVPAWVPVCEGGDDAVHEPMVGTLAWTARLAIAAWRAVPGRIDGQTCRFHPSCSVYARQALREHGLLAGTVLAAERLQRPHRLGDYPLCRRDSGVYLHDPVSAHDGAFGASR